MEWLSGRTWPKLASSYDMRIWERTGQNPLHQHMLPEGNILAQIQDDAMDAVGLHQT